MAATGFALAGLVAARDVLGVPRGDRPARRPAVVPGLAHYDSAIVSTADGTGAAWKPP